jgi:DNA repair exonuclease SbcCD ATPase subunit
MKEINFIKCGGENYALYIDPVEYEFINDKIRLITGPNGCLSGDTEIDFPRDLNDYNNCIKIKDLVGKEFYTYCYDIENKNLELKKAFNVRKTREKAEVWKLEFKPETRKRSKSYNYIIATPDHRFLKSDGTYCQLKDLKVGDSLMSLYRRDFDGYYHIRTTGGKEFYEHKFIGKKIFGESEEVHHKDLTRFNNDPINLDPITSCDHRSLHANYMYKHKPGVFMWKIHPKGMLNKHHSKESIDKITKNNGWKTGKINKEKYRESMKHCFDHNLSKNPPMNKDVLVELYVNQKRSLVELGKMYNCRDYIILSWLKKYDIQKRSKLKKQKNNHIVTKLNFYGYEDVFNIEVEDCHNFVANGVFVANSGKTSIFDIIPFTLFGVTSKGLKSDDVVNNTIGKNCHTYVEFTSSNSNITDHYRVDRYVKHSKFGDTVLLFKNDMKKPFKKGQKEVLPEVEKILVPQKLFVNTQSFGQKVKDFFTDLTDSERKDIFRKVLQLDNYVLYQDEVINKSKQVNIDLTECGNKLSINYSLFSKNEEQISSALEDQKNFEIRKTSEIQELTQKLSELNNKLSELLKERKSYEKFNDFDLTELNNEISSLLHSITTISAERDSQLKSLNDMKYSKESEFNSKLNELISKEDLLKSEENSKIKSSHQNYLMSIQETLSKIENSTTSTNMSIKTNESKIKENQNRINELSSSLNKSDATCPTCGKPLTEQSLKNHLTNELNSLVSSNNSMNSENIELKEKLEKMTNSKNDIKDDVVSMKNQMNEKIKVVENNYQAKISEIKQKHKEANQKLENLFNEKTNEIRKNSFEKEQEIDLKVDGLISKKNELVQKLYEKNKIEKDISIEESNIKTTIALIEDKTKQEYNDSFLKKCIEDRKKLFAEKEILDNEKLNLESNLEILNFWKTGFSSTGIPSILIDESIPFLNETVANYLDMVGGRYVVSFDTMSTTKSGEYRDKINVNVLDTQTKANKQKQLSGGQTRIVDIAILLSLCDLQNKVQDMKTNILLLDEIFDSLDDQNIGYVSNLIRTLVNGKSINIISHRHIDSIEADEVIRLF